MTTKKKTSKPKSKSNVKPESVNKRNISLREYQVLKGIKETAIAGFKVWLGKAKARTEIQWDNEFSKFLKS